MLVGLGCATACLLELPDPGDYLPDDESSGSTSLGAGPGESGVVASGTGTPGQGEGDGDGSTSVGPGLEGGGVTSGTPGQDEDSATSSDGPIEEPVCGNGVVEADEACDTAGASPTCNADCSVAQCGDGIVNSSAGEACDDGQVTETCDGDCTLVQCGDGVLNPSAGEICDEGGETATCDIDCSLAECGDGLLNSSAGEQCEGLAFGGATCVSLGFDGGTLGCNASCTYDVTACAQCGDGIVQSPIEACDGQALDGASCTSLGFDGGVLSCFNDCQFNVDSCYNCDGAGSGCRVIVSALNEAHTGALGGLAGADALCAQQAQNAGFGGIWYAYLSSTDRDLIDLFPLELPVENTNGAELLPRWGDIPLDSTSPANVFTFSGIEVEEGRVSPDWSDARAWVGSDLNGETSNATCNDWTTSSTTVLGVSSEVDTSGAGGMLSQLQNDSCSTFRAVLCVSAQ